MSLRNIGFNVVDHSKDKGWHYLTQNKKVHFSHTDSIVLNEMIVSLNEGYGHITVNSNEPEILEKYISEVFSSNEYRVDSNSAGYTFEIKSPATLDKISDLIKIICLNDKNEESIRLLPEIDNITKLMFQNNGQRNKEVALYIPRINDFPVLANQSESKLENCFLEAMDNEDARENLASNLRKLLAQGEDVYQIGSWNITPLHFAVQNFSWEIITILIEFGANPSIRFNNIIFASPLEWLIEQNKTIPYTHSTSASINFSWGAETIGKMVSSFAAFLHLLSEEDKVPTPRADGRFSITPELRTALGALENHLHANVYNKASKAQEELQQTITALLLINTQQRNEFYQLLIAFRTQLTTMRLLVTKTPTSHTYFKLDKDVMFASNEMFKTVLNQFKNIAKTNTNQMTY